MPSRTICLRQLLFKNRCPSGIALAKTDLSSTLPGDLSGDLSGVASAKTEALAKTEVGTKTEATAAKRDGYVFAKISEIRVNFFVPDLRSSEYCQAEIRLCGQKFVECSCQFVQFVSHCCAPTLPPSARQNQVQHSKTPRK
jgi:hypothetical protein